MNSRGQAALEYLMTYGWALVIIVVVAGILFFIISSPTAGVSCTSSDPAKMPIQGNAVAKTTHSIKIINGTGGNITLGTVTGAGSFNGIVSLNPTTSTTKNLMQSGAVLELLPACTTCSTSALLSGTTITINYNDQFNYTKQLVITCQGTPASP